MPRTPKPRSPLDELAEQAERALALCWARLAAGRSLDEPDIAGLVKAMRLKRQVHTQAEAIRNAKKEAKSE